jgi:3-dehydroquinate synthase
LIDAELVERQHTLLRAYGLPTHLPPELSAQAILALTVRDKKVQAGKVRWVLPAGLGSAVVRNDVPKSLVRSILIEAG